MNRIHTRGIARSLRAATIASALAIAGCEVVNPGRVLEADLDNPAALQSVVNGVVGALQEAYWGFAQQSTTMTGDLMSTAFSETVYKHWQGRQDSYDADSYNTLRAAVAIADRAIERGERVLGSDAASSPVMAQAYLWAGFVNRTAGDHFCNAVIDGGGPQPRAVYHERAVERFTDAIAVAAAAGRDDLADAAYAGRAHSSMQLGDWTSALADAGQIDTEFRFDLPGRSLGNERNVFYDRTVTQPHMGVRWTWWQEYADSHTDPRVSYYQHQLTTADGSGGKGLTPQKYTAISNPIALTKGEEMRLIEAEYAITQGGDWAGGLQTVNDIRNSYGQAPWPATNQDEAFEALKYERGIVLWQEVRRPGDLWRWGNTAVGDPFVEKMYELSPPPEFHGGSAGGLFVPIPDRKICFPYSQTMLDTNASLQ